MSDPYEGVKHIVDLPNFYMMYKHTPSKQQIIQDYKSSTGLDTISIDGTHTCEGPCNCKIGTMSIEEFFADHDEDMFA